jgi:hypothetical protein
MTYTEVGFSSQGVPCSAWRFRGDGGVREGHGRSDGVPGPRAGDYSRGWYHAVTSAGLTFIARRQGLGKGLGTRHTRLSCWG